MTASMPVGTERVARVRRRTLVVLVASQVFGGVGVATGVAVASLVAARLSGSDMVAGAAQTSMVLGAAVAALGLSRTAARRGRRPALMLGYLVAAAGAGLSVLAIELGSWQLLLAAMLPFGAATAAGLSARFAGTDLAEPTRQARTLAVVVWAVTVGAVAGPNLAAPTQGVATAVGLDPAGGPFLLCLVAFGSAAVVMVAGLRPDPLLLARRLATTDPGFGTAAPGCRTAVAGTPGSPARGASWRLLRTTPAARLGVCAVALAHGLMVGLMSLTPVHMDHGGASLRVVGLVISLHVAGMYALSPVYGLLADRVGRLPVLGGGAVLLILAGLIAGTADGADAGRLTVGLVALGLGWSATLVAGSALVASSVPVVDRVGVQGLSDVAMNVSGALGGVLAGVTVALGSYPVLAAGVALLAAPLLAAVLLAARRPVAGQP